MRRILCPQLPKPHRPVTLAETEANHAVRVLRLKDGDSVEAIDGQGHSAPAILRIKGGMPRLEVPATDTPNRAPDVQLSTAITPLTLEIAVLKGDAMEWVVEKCVELGVSSLQPLVTAHTVVQIKSKGPEVFQERWQKIADQALKQCGRLNKLEVTHPRTLEEILVESPSSPQAPRFWCDEGARVSAPELGSIGWDTNIDSTARLLIGPEGGWSTQERELLTQSQCTRISLGPLVLRAETAALYGVSLLTSAYRSLLLTKKHG